MAAADESKRQGGRPVTLESVMKTARQGGGQEARVAEAADLWQAHV